ncbi:MAG: type II secretion system F family protein [Phycisphaerae bacterium]|jgi:type IV pilus assembly protein PilC
MPWFNYEGQAPGGTAINGTIQAADTAAARGELERMRVSIRELELAPTPPPAGRISPDELMFFNEQLIGLSRAGLALDEGLAQLARDVQSRRLREWIEGLVQDLRRGLTIDQAIALRESGLPVLYSQAVRAGVETGRLPCVLLSINQHLRLASDTRRLFWEAISYPLVVGTLALCVMSFFFIAVAPKFKEIFQDFGTSLPALTILALEIAEHFPLILAVSGGVLAGLILIWWSLRFCERGRRWRERIVLAIPILGGVHRASLIARFLRAASVGVQMGMPLPRAVRLAADATGSRLLHADADLIARHLELGIPIDQACQGARIIPPLFAYCVKAAAERDDLPAALAQLARSYEDRAVHAQRLLRAVLLPLFVVLVGGFLMLAVVAMFLPLVHLVNSVSGGG